MILVDTSVWIEHLRRTGSRAHREFRDLASRDPGAIAICEPIAMELLAGPTDPHIVRRIEDQLGTLEDLAIDAAQDFRAAAALGRAVRRGGQTVRSLSDCLIAAIAMRHDTTVWHCDEDYVRIAAVTDLRHRDLRSGP
ncbi:type II toxin-antitoxin system VapC family toxin [Nocardioides sp.]|uniref:type II toxin-antitoxin system VapC family toxin n=1 Tax=Nocardioides sp. TaxID=35761 RepID=UPI002EDAA843